MATREDLELALEHVQSAQSAYWEALSRLENLLGCDLDPTRDYSSDIVDDLRPVASITTVNLLAEELQFVSDSQDVAAIREHLGPSTHADSYDAFFVHQKNGEYTEVWGICGVVPHGSKLTKRLK